MSNCAYCLTPDPTGMCPRCRREYGRARRAERYWTHERRAAARKAEAEAERMEAEGLALNRRFGLPDETTWSVPFERCSCDYCQVEGMHPDLPAEQLAAIQDTISDWYRTEAAA